MYVENAFGSILSLAGAKDFKLGLNFGCFLQVRGRVAFQITVSPLRWRIRFHIGIGVWMELIWISFTQLWWIGFAILCSQTEVYRFWLRYLSWLMVFFSIWSVFSCSDFSASTCVPEIATSFSIVSILFFSFKILSAHSGGWLSSFSWYFACPCLGADLALLLLHWSVWRFFYKCGFLHFVCARYLPHICRLAYYNMILPGKPIWFGLHFELQFSFDS